MGILQRLFGAPRVPPPQVPAPAPRTLREQPLCPTCAHELLPENLGGQGVSRCSTCQGTWIGSEVFRAVVSRAEQQVSQVQEQASELAPHGDRHTFSPSLEPRPCPLCDQPMENYQFDYSSGIFIDACPEDHGIWLDAGELALIAEHRRQASTPLSPQQKAALAGLAQTSMEAARDRLQAQTRRNEDLRDYSRHALGLHTGSPRSAQAKRRGAELERALSQSLADSLFG